MKVIAMNHYKTDHYDFGDDKDHFLNYIRYKRRQGFIIIDYDMYVDVVVMAPNMMVYANRTTHVDIPRSLRMQQNAIVDSKTRLAIYHGKYYKY